MKQLLVLSGKGGTGKTTVASAFIDLSNAKAYADCDVDAPNLHLVAEHHNKTISYDYKGMQKALVDPELCIGCGLCASHCRFDAIDMTDKAKVDTNSCEGCSVCEYVCPVDAIKMVDNVAGYVEVYQNEAVFSTAKLKMGEGNSGLLVTEVKNQLKPYKETVEFAVIDGSPGIGCPVISSISGVDLILVVAEPTVSGISDMDRIVKTAVRMGVKTAVCINKADINLDNSAHIKKYCENVGLPFVGEIPYDVNAIRLINHGKSVVSERCPSGEAIEKIYHEVRSVIK
ncbi:4Fe-4S binding protein [Fusibacter tunisiensis]|uniref:MinD superfamily P-loop ATPase n=1 Tax=Fusibacter tunisiensis TaxID=1008308 RepID=A0ABS2MRS7_9FIRM|nr:ATP-binding protein [Fusibacter tunisiensis]MBM7562118.1 MinD superfamily P-loop ATPase [Fusibacter tunisiensis]